MAFHEEKLDGSGAHGSFYSCSREFRQARRESGMISQGMRDGMRGNRNSSCARGGLWDIGNNSSLENPSSPGTVVEESPLLDGFKSMRIWVVTDPWQDWKCWEWLGSALEYFPSLNNSTIPGAKSWLLTFHHPHPAFP